MSTTQTKLFSDEDDSDDMGTGKAQAKRTKKRQRNTIKRFDDEQHATTATTAAAATTDNTPYFDDNEEDKKRNKREKTPKPKVTLKNKAPLDLDRQCGVLIAPLMNPCTRSLTCKVHAMGAKRAVEGRTRLFNELLAAYQKKGIGRPQVPAGSIPAHQQKSSSNKSNAQQHQANFIQDDIAIDSDEEAENVRIAIEQNRPNPLGCRHVYHVRRKREYHKLRDVLLEAITPKVNPTTSTAAFMK